jgi:predicted GNAT family N-acyltransferase
LTSPARRGDGTAEELIERVLWATAERWPGILVRVTAPVGMRAFYEQFGFRKVEGPFLDHGALSVGLTCRTRNVRASMAFARRERSIMSGAGTFENL